VGDGLGLGVGDSVVTVGVGSIATVGSGLDVSLEEAGPALGAPWPMPVAFTSPKMAAQMISAKLTAIANTFNSADIALGLMFAPGMGLPCPSPCQS